MAATYNAGQRKVTWTLAGELAAGAQVTRSFQVTVDAVPAGVSEHHQHGDGRR